MHVGVFPARGRGSGPGRSLPHARGGVSQLRMHAVWRLVSSPCTWGCFSFALIEHGREAVFPMHVGVFPMMLSCPSFGKGLPHARGGVSERAIAGKTAAVVFPMHVGVFLFAEAPGQIGQRLPHARGGVSMNII